MPPTAIRDSLGKDLKEHCEYSSDSHKHSNIPAVLPSGNKYNYFIYILISYRASLNFQLERKCEAFIACLTQPNYDH